MEKTNVIIQDTPETEGTSLQGYFPNNTVYNDLVEVFGESNGKGEDYKTDVEWIGKINDLVFTIYNYKDGKKYLKSQGKDIRDITMWHIGGKNKEVVKLLTEYLFDKKYNEEIKKCVICGTMFKLYKNAKTADTRTLCLKCRKAVRKI